MSTTNWDKALTYVATLKDFRHEHGEDRLKDTINFLLDAGGTFAVSQERLYLSDFSFEVFMKLIANWSEVDRALPEGTP